MKILGLRFKNLNSLYGEWDIDFTLPEYVREGIFAITGPTGSGKSTLLDAVCLALYGRTPRLNLITKTSNEVMSRRTGECFAEVFLETQAGRFRCHWSQRRAGQKPGGNLQDAKHEISDADTGKVLESGKREVASRIEDVTGMDFTRFTRSMLLAQGGFAAFLAASPDDRSPVLEQITGTEVYSDISKLVHSRKTEEHKKLDVLTAETAGITLLSDGEEACMLQELEKKREAEQSWGEKQNQIQTGILWLTGVDTLKTELLSIEAEFKKFAHASREFEPERKRLQQADNAAGLDGLYARLQSLRDQQKSDLLALSKIETLIPQRNKALEIKEADLSRAEADLLSVRMAEKKELFLIKEVRTLDLQISEKKAALAALADEYRKAEDEVAEKKGQKEKAILDLALAEKTLSEVNAYLLAHAPDESLLSCFAGIAEQVRVFTSAGEKQIAAKKEISRLRGKNASVKKQSQEQTSVCQRLREKHGEALTAVEKTKKEIGVLLDGRLLREYRAEQEGLLREMAYLKKIQSLEQERENLKDGSPCPLCGSLHHPFALGQAPRADQTEENISSLSGLIKKAEDLENVLKDREDLEKASALAFMEAEKQRALVQHEEEEIRTAIQRAEQELQALMDEAGRQGRALALNLEPFGIERIPDTGLDDLVENLRARQKNFQARRDQKIGIEKNKTDLSARISGMEMIIKVLDDRRDHIRVKGRDQKAALEQLIFERIRCYGNKNPDMEEARLEKKGEAAEKAVKDSRKNRDDIREELRESLTRISALRETAASRETEIVSREASFLQACRTSGFENEAVFLSFRLSLDERKKLSERAGRLDEALMDLLARKNDREQRLLIEIQKNLTDQGLEDLKKEAAAVRESLKLLGEETGAIKQKLSENQSLKERVSQKKKFIDLQKTECARWDSLHGLIGSADGKKYRNFAQGLTFEMMVAHANRQLEKMSDRYLLIRDEAQPLELNIVDNYQAGEIRSTKNLSGGESFIVSLSLALGLSHMSGRKVRVDSLFLDEGFGTLDEEALETALEALAGLHRQGKLIGIISHVSALKERIGTRISITPVSGGKSALGGPGCKAVQSG